MKGFYFLQKVARFICFVDAEFCPIKLGTRPSQGL